MSPAELLDLHLPGWADDPAAARLVAQTTPPRLRRALLDALAAHAATPKQPKRRKARRENT